MNRPNRLVLFVIAVVFCLGLIAFSLIGLTAPAEGLLAVPVQIVQGILSGVVQSGGGLVDRLLEIQNLETRNGDLERALAALQAEVVDLREIAYDYERIAGLLDYTEARAEQEFVVADVISRDISALRRILYVNRGARDGLTDGMPVVTELGLVGRITQVSATAAQVLLITDPLSAINARLLNSRADGSVQGQLTTALNMTYIDLAAMLEEGDTVITSGLGGNFPEGIIIGQVTSIRQFEFELYQEVEVRSFNDFERLETVLVVTNFQPIDLSVFGDPGTAE
ncbi:MAG: rod shape-determining protein MreC [Anaerolineae bacterium]|nr:rod shape-determining protein MreC [Anaerolineae bacterium]